MCSVAEQCLASTPTLQRGRTSPLQNKYTNTSRLYLGCLTKGNLPPTDSIDTLTVPPRTPLVSLSPLRILGFVQSGGSFRPVRIFFAIALIFVLVRVIKYRLIHKIWDFDMWE